MTVSRNKGSTRFQDLSAAKSPLPSAELDKEFNDLVEWINNNIQLTQNISEWALHENTPTFVSGTDFTISGDQEAVFTAGRALKPNLNGTYVYTHVKSSSYSGGSGLTTVVCHDNVLTSSLTQIYFAILDPANPSIPKWDQRDRGCLATRSSNQTISTNSLQAAQWNAEQYDTDSFHSTASNYSRITIPTGSGITKVRFSCNIVFAVDATGDRAAHLYKNGATFPMGGIRVSKQAAGNPDGLFGMSGILTVSEGDYFEIMVWQSSGGDLTLQYNWSWFSMEVIK